MIVRVSLTSMGDLLRKFVDLQILYFKVFEDKNRSIKNNLIKVRGPKIYCSKIEYNLLILETVQNISNISKNVSK